MRYAVKVGIQLSQGDIMTGKIRIELEGDAYTDAITTADKFIETVVERLTRIEELVEDNRDAVENIAEAVKSLENAMKILKDD
tara:strand:- start:188 stop:436 length:249 start_codon:yes stop_codon:yes gene_type:complete